MAQVSWDTSFAPPPPPNLQSRRQEHPNQIKVSKSGAGTILLDTTSCPRGTGQGDAKAQSVLHSRVKPSLKPRTHLKTPDPLLEIVLNTKCADPYYRTPPPPGGRIHHVAYLMGTFSSKEGFHLDERTPTILGPPASKSSWCYPLVFLSRSLFWEEENTG